MGRSALKERQKDKRKKKGRIILSPMIIHYQHDSIPENPGDYENPQKILQITLK